MRVLLVEDDECIAKTLETALTRENYAVDVALDGEIGWRLIEAFSYDLILLDVMLPKRDGITLCRQLRQHNYQTPVLLLTAQNSSTDRIAGLDAGADDYMVKPFEFPELLARMRVLLRRGSTPVLPVLEWHKLRLDLAACTVSYDDRLLPLTPKEYRLLELFLRNPYRVFTRSSILEHLWGVEETPGEDTVTAHIKGLRHKLKQVGAPATLIETVYGMGYRLKQMPADADAAEAPPTNGSQSHNRDGHSAAHTATETTETDPAPSESNAERLRQELEAGWQKQTRLALQQVWAKYAAQNQARLAILEQAILALQSQQLDEDLRHQAYAAAHKLAGSLGVFEFPNGSRLATELEQGFKSPPRTERASLHLVNVFTALQQELQQISETVLPTQVDIQTNIQADAQTDTQFHLQPGISLYNGISSSNYIHPSTPSHSQIHSSMQPLKLLLIDDDLELMNRLRHWSGVQAVAVEWLQPETLTELLSLTAWVKRSSEPPLLMANLSLVAHLDAHLAIFTELSHRLPPVSVVLLSDRADLPLRVRLAKAGVHSIVPKAMAEQVMSLLRPFPSAASAGRIMMVDDDPFMLAQMHTLLHPWRLQLTSIEQATQLWQRLQTDTPDLLILDVEMPEVNGIELCRAIRSVPRWQRLPILFLTVHSDAATLRQMLDAGADALLNKPIVESDVILRVLSQLEKSRMEQAICR